MAAIIIDEFSAKPSGFLASWRYIRVIIDTETHLITNLCVPGKECINRPNLSDYQKVSRRYNSGDVITTFCDFVTFERVTVTASNTEPFAIATIETDVAACGYLTPLPTPAVPPNPFGTVPYGAYKSYEFCDETRTYNYEVIIYKKNFAGLLTEIVAADPVPISQSYKRSKKFDPVVGCEFSFGWIASSEFDCSVLYSDDEREYKAEVYRNGVLYFSGFVVPDLSEEPFKPYPYPVTITITDGLALLHKQSYPTPIVNNSLTIQQPFLYMLAFCFAQTGLQLDILSACNLYEEKMLNGANDDPLVQAKANPLRLADDWGMIKDCYSMIEEIARLFGAIVFQADGIWQFVRVNELAQQVIRARRYNYTGLFLYPTQLSNVLNIGIGEDVEIINDNARKYRGQALKYANVHLKYGFVPGSVYNGNFEQWDGANFTYWTAFGGLSFSRIQKSVSGASGQPVLLDDYCLQFNEAFSAFKYMLPNDVSAGVDDTLNITFNLGSTGLVDEFIFRLRGGEYWLRNTGTGFLATPSTTNNGNYEWVKSGIETCQFLTGFGRKDINQYQVQIAIPPLPDQGELQIFVVGFRKWSVTAQSINHVVTEILVPATYDAVQIDNFSIGLTRNPSENTPTGTLYKSQQDKVYTNSEDVDIIFGDNESNSIFQSVNNRRYLYDPLKNNLHSIFTADNSYSKLWYDYGADSTKLPIGSHLAKAILKAHQRGYMLMDCDLKAPEAVTVNYLSVFNICNIPTKQFMFLAVEFDLYKNQMNNCTLVEMFDRNIITQDTGVLDAPARIASLPPQDQTALAYWTEEDSDRIFYPQFEEEFT